MFQLCATNGCGALGVFKFEFKEDDRDFWLYVCPRCILYAPKLLREVASIQKKERKLLANKESRSHGR